MTAVWSALESCDFLNLAADGFTPVYTGSSTETPYIQVFTETAHVRMAKQFHTIIEDLSSTLIVTPD